MIITIGGREVIALMSTPFFSIVIPTRNRPETIPYTLATCIHQKGCNDYEVIISDNSDEQEAVFTRKSIEPYLGSRVRYVCPPDILPMTEHWEFALQFATGKYVTYLGDDDGLTLNALATYKSCIDQTGALALTSNGWHYIWPETFKGKEANKNCITEYIRWPLRFENTMKTKDDWVALDCRYQMQGFLNFKFDQQSLPCIYRGVIASSLIQDIRKQKGLFFDSVIPDVYSALIVSLNTPVYYMIKSPIRIVGTSPKSNGLATNASHIKQGNKFVQKDFESLIKKKKIIFGTGGVVPWEAHLEGMLYAKRKNKDIAINFLGFYMGSLEQLLKDLLKSVHSYKLFYKYFLIASYTHSWIAFISGVPLAFFRLAWRTTLHRLKCIIKFFLSKVRLYQVERVAKISTSKKSTNVYEASTEIDELKYNLL